MFNVQPRRLPRYTLSAKRGGMERRFSHWSFNIQLEVIFHPARQWLETVRWTRASCLGSQPTTYSVVVAIYQAEESVNEVTSPGVCEMLAPSLMTSSGLKIREPWNRAVDSLCIVPTRLWSGFALELAFLRDVTTSVRHCSRTGCGVQKLKDFADYNRDKLSELKPTSILSHCLGAMWKLAHAFVFLALGQG